MRKKNISAYDTVNEFEKTIADYAGSKYAVAVDSCCNALFLCLKYYSDYMIRSYTSVDIPKRTYPGVACSIIHNGYVLLFRDRKWRGAYELGNTKIYDSALRFKWGMYIKGSFYCLSFHAKKHLPIGRGGMILCDDRVAYEWFKKARFDGRSEVPLKEDKIEMVGYNMYLTPEQAARGLMLFDTIKDKTLPDINPKTQGYPDLSKIEAYQ